MAKVTQDDVKKAITIGQAVWQAIGVFKQWWKHRKDKPPVPEAE